MSGEERPGDQGADDTGPRDRRSEFLRSRGLADEEDFYGASRASPVDDEDSGPEQPRQPEDHHESQ